MRPEAKLFAPELARKQITAKAICPTLVPVGTNSNVGDLRRKLEASRVPPRAASACSRT